MVQGWWKVTINIITTFFSWDKSNKFSKHINVYCSQRFRKSIRSPFISMEGPQFLLAEIRNIPQAPEGTEALIQMPDLDKRTFSGDQTLHYNWRAIFIPLGTWCCICTEMFLNRIPLCLSHIIWACFYILRKRKVQLSYSFPIILYYSDLYTFQLNSCP